MLVKLPLHTHARTDALTLTLSLTLTLNLSLSSHTHTKILHKHYTINGLKSSLKKCLKKHRWITTKLGLRLHWKKNNGQHSRNFGPSYLLLISLLGILECFYLLLKQAACQFAADDILLCEFCYYIIQWIFISPIRKKGKKEKYHYITKISYYAIKRKCCKEVHILWTWITQSLQWRRNGLDGVSNHQPHHCLLSRLFGRRSKKTSKLRVTGLCAGNSPWTGEFPHKWPVTRKMFPSFDDVIMMKEPEDKKEDASMQCSLLHRCWKQILWRSPSTDKVSRTLWKKRLAQFISYLAFTLNERVPLSLFIFVFQPSIEALLCLIFARKGGCYRINFPHDPPVGKTMPEFFWKQSFLKGFPLV